MDLAIEIVKLLTALVGLIVALVSAHPNVRRRVRSKKKGRKLKR